MPEFRSKIFAEGGIRIPSLINRRIGTNASGDLGGVFDVDGYTFQFPGNLVVTGAASDPATYILPFIVPQAGSIIKCYYVLGSGTATIDLRLNGTTATGFGAMSVTTTKASTAPTAVAVVEGDLIQPYISATSSGINLSVGVLIQY